MLLSSHILAEVEALCDRVTHHPRRPHGRDRHAGRAAPPHAHLDRRPRLVQRAGRARARSPACTRCTSTDHRARFDVDTSQLDDGRAAARRARRAQPRQPAADARGAVPAPLRRRRSNERAGRDRRAGSALALRRDRVRIPVCVLAVRARWSPRPRPACKQPVPDRGRPGARLRRDASSGNPGADRAGRAAARPRHDRRLTSRGRSAASARSSSALMSMLIVGRHTRAEEESGRSELVGAAPVGRFAPLTAALIVVVGRRACCSALLVALALIGAGPAAGGLARARRLVRRRRARVRRRRRGRGPGQPRAHVAMYGHRRRRARRARTCCARRRRRRRHALVALADRLGPADAPVRRRALVAAGADRCVATVALVVGGAVALRARRDLGAGLVAPRPGPPAAAPRLTHPLGLALRLQRGVLLGWSVGLFISGVSIGLTGRDAKSLVGDSSEISDILDSRRGRHRRPVPRGLDARDGADRRRLRHPGRAAAARRGDQRPARAAARHGALALGVERRLRRGRDGGLGARARRQRASAPASPTRSTATTPRSCRG